MLSRLLRLPASLIVVTFPLLAFAVDTDDGIEEIVITADYRGRSIDEFPASVTVLDNEQVKALAVQHFEELVGIVPNFNWSGDGHRARYFQIRGIGELEQYQGAPNPSVGFLIDDIDFSGIGTVATLFDMQRVEVLRGPQGSRYGANALAGLVYLQSTEPTAQRDGRAEVMVAGDDAWSAGLAIGGSMSETDTALYRLSAHHHSSDGFRDNPYLGRDDTNGRDESALRGRVRLLPSDVFTADIALMYTDIDNGYDAFAIDNSLTMLSDKPGKDAQKSIGASVRLEWDSLDVATLTSITSFADSDIDFSFDADWGNDDSWAPVLYDYTSVSHRERQTVSQELRLTSNPTSRLFGDTTDWLVGIYAMNLEESLVTVDTGEYYDPGYDFADSLDSLIRSSFDATNFAVFTQLDTNLGTATRLGFGVRIEHRSADYVDSEELGKSPSDTMWGGELSISHDHSDALTSYATLSKGYKAGGFNLGLVPPGERDFDAEELWTVEAGIKAVLPENAVSVNASLFFSRPIDQQVRTSQQLVPGDPTTFVFFTDNVGRGEIIGLEADVRWAPDDNWDFYVNLGLLDSTFAGGREQPHAPAYTVAAGGQYRHDSGWYARIDASAKDWFYFDVSHDQRSDAYELVNARLGFDADQWSAQLWVRNLFDRQYAVRGFYFGNEPPDFPSELYIRQGDPRQVGLTLERRF
ncbi:MAG: TonB-dependent receptor [Woeseiaceae bacterium]|nr:TonB-dependent receptor [Woeseiaceae bacterium]